MSTKSGHQKPAIIIKKVPIILKRKSLVISGDQLVNIRQPVWQEDVIYESKAGDFLRGESRGVKIINKLNRHTNSSVTIARYLLPSNDVVERSSERVSNLIGQQNYDTVFSALCSVISQELKVRGILALLTLNKAREASTQTATPATKTYKESSSQTEETAIDVFVKAKPKKRIKRQALTPYVAKTVEKQVKKVVINPEDYKSDLTELSVKSLELNENSNDSACSFSALSVKTTNSLMYDPNSWLDSMLDKHTRQDTADLSKNSSELIEMPTVVAPSNNVIVFSPAAHQNSEQKRQLALSQALTDYKTCLVADEDGNLPIHDAVKNNDVGLLLRQCMALTARKRSVDEPSGDWTPLKMAILKDLPNLTSILLRFGANPLLTDADQKTSIHHASEMSHAHLQAIVDHCMKNPRIILEQNDELWHEDYEKIDNDILARLFLGRMCSMCDRDGYTPLMLASKLGLSENVETLVEIAPTTVNKQMPTSGNTALYLSVGAACNDCVERGDKTVVTPSFHRTIEVLVESGADPTIANHSGSNVNVLLTEFNIAPLSTLVANKLTSINCFNGLMPENSKSFDSYMLVKNSEGNINVIEMDTKNMPIKLRDTKKNAQTKPVIVENILLSSGQKRKATDSDAYVKVFKSFVKSSEENLDTVVKAGKAGVIKDLTIDPGKKSTEILQPAKKRIKKATK